jgi:hypothetical protein
MGLRSLPVKRVSRPRRSLSLREIVAKLIVDLKNSIVLFRTLHPLQFHLGYMIDRFNLTPILKIATLLLCVVLRSLNFIG